METDKQVSHLEVSSKIIDSLIKSVGLSPEDVSYIRISPTHVVFEVLERDENGLLHYTLEDGVSVKNIVVEIVHTW